LTRVRLRSGQNQTDLTPVGSLLLLKPGRFFRADDTLLACFDLSKGSSRLELAKG
jgi:hypothetical protein